MKPLFLLAALAALASSAFAGSPDITPADPSGWEFTTALYAPLMGMEGTFEADGVGPQNADVPFDKILDHLDGALSGAFEAERGRWSIAADAIWLKLSGSGNALLDSRIDVTQQQLTTSMSVAYEIFDNGCTSFGVAAGGALNRLDLELELSTPHLPVSERGSSGVQTWIDPFVGVRFQHQFGDSWRAFATANLGGFGVSSDEYWQAIAGVGYRISEHFSVALAYRAISVDYRQGGFLYDTITHGPNLGLVFKF